MYRAKQITPLSPKFVHVTLVHHCLSFAMTEKTLGILLHGSKQVERAYLPAVQRAHEILMTLRCHLKTKEAIEEKKIVIKTNYVSEGRGRNASFASYGC